ncbi:uncharacterized protein BDV14DRAFT_196704 [Aspergillus stella-maris]|uniref:uncharacterized protein n=1 Tax=Aspergillus stella-maris TaxID=1810926 RepID=UPI003CCDDE5D
MSQVQESPCLGAKPASEAAEALDHAEIRYVCVGWLPFALYLKDAGTGEVELVVRDKDFEAAVDVLQRRFQLWDDPDCVELLEHRVSQTPRTSPGNRHSLKSGWNITHLIAGAHFHLETTYEGCDVLSLYKKNSILRWFPILEDQPEKEDVSLIWTSTDSARLPAARPGGPSGAWTKLHPVRMPSPTTFCEMILMILFRDHAQVNGRYFSFAKMWTYLVTKGVQYDRPLRSDFRDLWKAAEDAWHDSEEKPPYAVL